MKSYVALTMFMFAVDTIDAVLHGPKTVTYTTLDTGLAIAMGTALVAWGIYLLCTAPKTVAKPA